MKSSSDEELEDKKFMGVHLQPVMVLQNFSLIKESRIYCWTRNKMKFELEKR